MTLEQTTATCIREGMMARNSVTNNTKRSAFSVSGQHASIAIKQKRLIHLGRAANDNRAPKRIGLRWLVMTAAVTAVALVWLV